MLTAPHVALVRTELSILPRCGFIYIAWRRLSLYIKVSIEDVLKRHFFPFLFTPGCEEERPS